MSRPGSELAVLWLVALYAATGVVLLRFVRGWQTPAAPTGTAPMSVEIR